MKRTIALLSFGTLLAISALAQSPIAVKAMSCNHCCKDKCSQCCPDGCTDSCCK